MLALDAQTAIMASKPFPMKSITVPNSVVSTDHLDPSSVAPQSISGASQLISRAPQRFSSALDIKPFPAINSADLSTAALICIGSETSRAMDQLGLSDNIIPRLRALVCEMRSSRWEQALCEPQWGLNRKAAGILAQALHSDITGKKV